MAQTHTAPSSSKDELDTSNHPDHIRPIVVQVIGTLYCTKGNFEFGISRIIKSLAPCRTNGKTN